MTPRTRGRRCATDLTTTGNKPRHDPGPLLVRRPTTTHLHRRTTPEPTTDRGQLARWKAW